MHIPSKLRYGLTAVFFLSFCAFSIFGSSAQEDDIKRTLERLNQLPESTNWEITSDSNSITLTSAFTLGVSPSYAIAGPQDADGSAFQSSSPEQPFRIQILFLPFETYQDLESRLKEREAITEKLNKDTYDFEGEPLDQEEWETLMAQFSQSCQPTHVAGESVVCLKSDLDNPELSFEPSEALKNCIWMRYRLGLLFSEIYR